MRWNRLVHGHDLGRNGEVEDGYEGRLRQLIRPAIAVKHCHLRIADEYFLCSVLSKRRQDGKHTGYEHDVNRENCATSGHEVTFPRLSCVGYQLVNQNAPPRAARMATTSNRIDRLGTKCMVRSARTITAIATA